MQCIDAIEPFALNNNCHSEPPLCFGVAGCVLVNCVLKRYLRIEKISYIDFL